MTKPLSIAITNPFVWPWVRRGSERLLNDLAEYYASLGYPTEVYAMGPETRLEIRGEVTYQLLKQRFNSPLRQWNSCHYFAFALIKKFKHCNADIVHCLNYFDAYAAIKAKKKYNKSYKVVFHAVGIPISRYFRAIPIDKLFMATVLRKSDVVLVLSEFARERLAEDFNCQSIIMPPPVDLNRFKDVSQSLDSVSGEDEDYLLFVGDVDEKRKGAKVMCRAYTEVSNAYPTLKLKLSGRVSDETRASLLNEVPLKIRDKIEFLGVGDVNDLPALYANARLTILPSVWEAFGLVLIESLASGTPVVGAKHGGITDIVTDEQIGMTFDTGNFNIETENVKGLTDSILKMLETPKTADISKRCRAHAEQFSWNVLGQHYLNLYRRII